jgi:hypothetical protein
MSLKYNSHFVTVGGMPYEMNGRALGPYRIRTVAQKAGYVTSIIDYPWVLTSEENEQILNYVIGSNTLAIGISYTWEASPSILAQERGTLHIISEYLKQKAPHVKVIIGCANVSRLELSVAKLADWVIGGFAEISLPILLDHLAGKLVSIQYKRKKIGESVINIISSNVDYVVEDMTIIETIFEPQDLFELHQPLTIETCRGCVFSCAYCSYQFTGKKDYQYIRPVENLADEFRRNYDMFGTTRYAIADDTFNDSMEKITRIKRAVDLAKLPNFEFACYIRPELLVLKPEMIPALIDLGIRAAHFGLESYNDKSRRVIGRSSSIEKVIDAIRELKSKSKQRIGTLGSFIVGLPYDTQDQLEGYNHHLQSSDNDYLDSWAFGALILHNQLIGQQIKFKHIPGEDRGGSAMEKFPEKYGYTVLNNGDSIFAKWKNNHMTSHDAGEIAKRFNDEGSLKMSYGGWFVSAGWYFGLSDTDMQQTGSALTHQLITNRPSFLFNRGRQSCRNRANYWIKNIS